MFMTCNMYLLCVLNHVNTYPIKTQCVYYGEGFNKQLMFSDTTHIPEQITNPVYNVCFEIHYVIQEE